MCHSALQPGTLPSVTQLATLPENCRLQSHFIRKGKISTFDRYGGKTFSSFRDCHQKFRISFRFTYLFRFVITSCELFFAFRHLISDLTLTRAVHLISSYVLNTVYLQNPARGSLTIVEDGRVFVFFRLASCTTACCRRVVPGAI
jgi:hypothetical protein